MLSLGDLESLTHRREVRKHLSGAQESQRKHLGDACCLLSTSFKTGGGFYKKREGLNLMFTFECWRGLHI